MTAQQYCERVAGPNIAASPFVYDASYVMLREMILSYKFPTSIVGKSFIKGVQVSLVGRNLFLLSKNADTPAFVLDEPVAPRPLQAAALGALVGLAIVAGVLVLAARPA